MLFNREKNVQSLICRHLINMYDNLHTNGLKKNKQTKEIQLCLIHQVCFPSPLSETNMVM